MAYREVIDADGITWQVWDVIPGAVEQRIAAQAPPLSTGERRKARAPRVRMPAAQRAGWLAMKCATERRRVMPIPDGWHRRSDAELLAIIERARPQRGPRRLIE